MKAGRLIITFPQELSERRNDSEKFGIFGETDRKYLEEIISHISENSGMYPFLDFYYETGIDLIGGELGI